MGPARSPVSASSPPHIWASLRPPAGRTSETRHNLYGRNEKTSAQHSGMEHRTVPTAGQAPCSRSDSWLGNLPGPRGAGALLLAFHSIPSSFQNLEVAHKPKLRGRSLLTADRLSYSLSQWHLFPDYPVPAPPSLETHHLLPNTNYTCPGDRLPSVSIFLCISLLLPCPPPRFPHSTCPVPVGGSSQFACVLP